MWTVGLPRLLYHHRQSQSYNSWPRWESTRAHELNESGDASDALRESIHTVHKGSGQVCWLTVLCGAQLVEVPHYEFTVPRTCEDLVVVAWAMTEVSFPIPMVETYFLDPKRHRY